MGDGTPGDDRPGIVRITRSLSIPTNELVWRFTGSGGPGGQHANTANTRVELIFDIATSPSLAEHQRALLLHRVGPTIRVVASDTRSQSRNRALALERLAERLAEAMRQTRPRRATAPTRASKKRRVEHKRVHSKVKQRRRRPDLDD